MNACDPAGDAAAPLRLHENLRPFAGVREKYQGKDFPSAMFLVFYILCGARRLLFLAPLG